MTPNENCCVVACESPLDQNYWDAQYQAQQTGWDLGCCSPAFQALVNRIENKNAALLIPGCGSSYETEYLLSQGFTNITLLDIAPTLVNNLQVKFAKFHQVNVVLGDFFAHQNQYDYILEQTFFCALPPALRVQYVAKMHELLKPNGQLMGLLFDTTFEVSPPFGGSKDEYISLFESAFTLLKLDKTTLSVPKRLGSELAFQFQKKGEILISTYQFKGITCMGCKTSVMEKFAAIPTVLSAQMNLAFDFVLLTSTTPIALSDLQAAIAYDSDYQLTPLN
ncbi:MAG: methyltransferase [Flavobacterium sp.]|nr:methyltransferase [Flavobacterium sp.]